MRRVVGTIPIVTCLVILVHDAGSGRMSVFRDPYRRDALNRALHVVAEAEGIRRGTVPQSDVVTPLTQAERLAHDALHKSSTADAARALIARGASVNVADENGNTPLHTAASSGAIDVMAVLLDAGARIDRTNNKGKTALSEAVAGGHMQATRALVRDGAALAGCLAWAVWYASDCESFPRQLLQERGRLSPETMERWQHHCEVEGVRRREFVTYLLECGADVNGRDKDGLTPLDLALLHDAAVVVALLRQHGAKTGKEMDEEARE